MFERCGHCRLWVPPDPEQRKPIGRCQRDDAPVHGGASCRWFCVTPQVAMRVIGLSEDELAWLRKNATHPIAAALRRSVRLVADHTLDHAVIERGFVALEAWRADPAYPFP